MTAEEAVRIWLTGAVTGKFCGKDQLIRRREEMTLIVCLLTLFLNKETFLNLQQRNVAVVDGLVVSPVKT